MKLFYNDKGEIVGSFIGATPEIEANIGLPSNAVGAVHADPELAYRLDNPMDDLQPHHLTITDGVPVPQEMESPRSQPAVQ